MEERHALPGEAPTTRAAAERTRGHAAVVAVAALLLVALAALRWVAEPDGRGYGTHEQFGLPPCTMMAATGVPCPGCGVTTSMSMAVHGRWRDAFANQPFGVLVVLAIPLFALWVAWGHARGRDRAADVGTWFRGRAWLAVGLALAACWAWKIATL